MADFEKALKYVLENEGGFTNNEHDPGHATNFGITKKTASSFYRRDFTDDEMKCFTREQASEIYKKWYWDDMRLGEIKDTGVATCIFDLEVNLGHGQASFLTELALTDFGVEQPVVGRWSYTIRRINTLDPKKLIIALHEKALRYYESTADHTPTLAVFLKGWTNRANRMLQFTKDVA